MRMIASTSNNTDTCANHSADDDHQSPPHSILLLPSKNKHKKEESDSNSDTFNDFETAKDGTEGTNRREGQHQKEDLPTNLPCSSLSSSQVTHSPFDMQISQLLEETLHFSELEFDHHLLSHCQPLVDGPMANVFSLLNTDKGCTDGTQLDGVEGLALKSLCLWQQICRFEEMRLLNVRWENLRGRQLLNQALPLMKSVKAMDHPKGKTNRVSETAAKADIPLH